MHEANRVKLAEMMPKGSRGVALLQGGDQQTRYDTDHEPVFRQESYFQYLFGVSEAGCFGAVSLPRSAHALHCLCTLWTLSACSGTLRGPCLHALHAPHRPCTVSAPSPHPRRTLAAPSLHPRYTLATPSLHPCRTLATPALQAAVWTATAEFLSARLQSSTKEMVGVVGFEQRTPDMSEAAAAAFRAVLSEVAAEEVASFFKRAVTPLAVPAAAVRPAAQVGP